ncbi:MAG: choice-of-anchor X domain-containing protein [Candidatus Promineifilaceae bacterium]|nr:choice-of-anchor X domain-containing protein [Candidatus Promineifilaceae bacterium]
MTGKTLKLFFLFMLLLLALDLFGGGVLAQKSPDAALTNKGKSVSDWDGSDEISRIIDKQATLPVSESQSTRAPSRTGLQVILNGGFEESDGTPQIPYWFTDNIVWSCFSSDPSWVRSGLCSASIGDDHLLPFAGPLRHRLRQSVTDIPQDSYSAKLEFWYRVESIEGDCFEDYLFLNLTVGYHGGAGSSDQIPIFTCPASVPAGWQKFEQSFGGSVASITVDFDVTTNDDIDTDPVLNLTEYTRVFVDDISLIVDYPPIEAQLAPPDGLKFNAIAFGSPPQSQQIELDFSVGPPGATPAWSVQEAPSWIDVSPTSGNGPTTLDVSVTDVNKPAGTYVDSLTITSPYDIFAPISTSITLEVDDPLGLALVNTDVGIIPGSGGCPSSMETIVIHMDDEDDGNLNFAAGWLGAMSQDDNTNLVFCRVPGDDFHHIQSTNFTSPPQSETSYAVLKLGDQCPNGSLPFSRSIDNEDGNNNNSYHGNIYPNTSNRNTTLHFCFFDGVSDLPAAGTMTHFPNYHFEYGVFAAEGVLELGLSFGWIHTDDEDNRNKNGQNMIALSAEAGAVAATIISGGADTDMKLAKVRDPADPGRPDLCNGYNYCQANPRPIDLSISLHGDCQPANPACQQYQDLIYEFADDVYEMSNGVHRIRDVIFNRFGSAPWSDVIWINARDEVSADLSGVSSRFHHIYMADIFDGEDFLTNPIDRARGANTLAHELGHYYYGVMDEYAVASEDNCYDGALPQPCSSDNGVQQSIMGPRLASPLIRAEEFSAQYNFNKKNTQFRRYGADAWATLRRHPSEDPRLVEAVAEGTSNCEWWERPFYECQTTFREPSNPRRHYPELDLVASTNISYTNLVTTTARMSVTFQFRGSKPLTLVPVEEGQISYSGDSQLVIPVDEGAERFEGELHYPRSPAAVIIVRDPSDTPRKECPTIGIPEQKEFVCRIDIENPEPGDWTVDIKVPSAPVEIDHDLRIIYPTVETQYHATVWSPQGSLVTYPEPMMVVAQVNGDLPITGVGVNAYFENPDGQRNPLELNDDGTAPDSRANDGRYSGYLNYDQDGMYRIAVSFDNDAGNAAYTEQGLADGGNGLEPVGENFHRGATLFIEVENHMGDDHGDAPVTATPLEPDNVDIPGRIDFAGDEDLFMITPIQDGQLVVRVTGLGQEMEPRMRVLEEDCSTLIEEVEYVPGSGVYPFTLLEVIADVPICIEVSHIDPNATRGLYYVSSGAVLESEKENNTLYLPILIK